MARDEQTEDYDTRGRASGEAWCVRVSVHEPFVLQLPPRGSVTFGRGAEADIQLSVPSVSRNHVMLTTHGDQRVEISDLQSRNGTQVNGATLAQSPAVLSRGDEVSFGAVSMVLLPASALWAGARSLRHARALWAHLDVCVAQSAVVVLSVLRLRAAFHECAGLGARLSALPADVVIGLVDERTLALVRQERDLDVGELRAWEQTEALTSVRHEGQGRTRGASLLSAALCELSAPPAAAASPSSTQAQDVQRIARSTLSVLIVGETGVGKEVMARSLHTQSGRTGPLVSVNAAALPETLIESELFGHERGAFSGADRKKTGLFEAAHRGTLFLDEIGDLPLALQAKLLRVLEDKKIRPLGATSERQIDVRVIAATHRDLASEVVQGRFRQDLFFRLNACVLRVPPLRERALELESLCHDLLAKLASESNRTRAATVTPRALALLRAHAWPGNIRELKNALELAVTMVEPGGAIGPAELPAYLRTAASGPAAPAPPTGAPEPPPAAPEVREALQEYERASILAALDAEGGSVARAAAKLGLPRRTLAYRMARLGIRTK